jgi:hypothetical protein
MTMKGLTWRRFRRSRWWCVVILLAAARAAGAGPLDPNGFPLSGTGDFPTLAGAYTISTDGTPTISGPGGISIQGLVYSDAPGHSLAVFDFNSITIGSGQTFSATGALPLVLLSRGDTMISGVLDASGYGSVGGPGGGGGTANPGPGSGNYIFENGSGGGFGGVGGWSGQYTFFNPSIRPIPSLPGGKAYGDLTVSLQGGSAGGVGVAAGGGVEIGAVGKLTVNPFAQILANGASQVFALGGGSGGGIFLHGDSVTIGYLSRIYANGGDGGRSVFNGGPGGGSGGGGGGGGGGRILFEYGSSLTYAGADLQAFGGNTRGGAGASPGGDGTLTYGPYGGPYTTTFFPEPSSFVLGTIAACALTGVRWLVRRRDRSRNS